ncbi:hypothetical protein A9G11_11865 [Gilliamella sp. wkB108]|nr:hypothetical protein A9G11_11865 [Gilliamella apicola]
MIMSYMQFMQNADNDQKRQIEVEKIQSTLLKELSYLDYEASDEIKESLYDIAEKLVKDRVKVRGFRNMSLAQFCEAYEKAI